MKRIALLAVIGGSLLALPSTAAAQAGADCDTIEQGPVGVEVSQGPPARACVNVNVNGNDLGGEVVVDEGTASCSYINGWEDNPSNGAGYGGLCTDAVSRGPSCNTSGGSGENTGGCLQTDLNPGATNDELNTPPVSTVTAMVICGASSGENPDSTSRDGCSIP